MLDGGISDSIPLERAMSLGYDNNLVVLTRNHGYRKPQKATKVPFFFYRKYPNVKDAIRGRNAMYNAQMELVETMEREGRVEVLRPVKPVEVGRIERDIDKLLALYQEGYDLAAQIEFDVE
jgi:predicted patatin/cPLA2 family phospholipase